VPVAARWDAATLDVRGVRGETRAMPEEAWVLTSRSTVRVLSSGYRPVLHDSARD
jgi:hypothetical protein